MYCIETKEITKMYGSFIANSTISLRIKKNEIKAIVGENGAGKTTLMNMLYGLIKPTSGKICINGQTVSFNSPLDSIKIGLGMVHQHFKLVPSLSIFENVLLGIEIKKTVKIGKKVIKLPIINKEQEAKKVQEIANQYKLELDVTKKIEDISIGEQQRVEILKMLYRDVDILILDEPTAVLTPQEVDELIINLKELQKMGKTIIIITHKLREVMKLSDSVTVLKRGRVVGDVLTKDTSEKELSRMMTGRDVVLNVDKKYCNYEKSNIVYEVNHLETINESKQKLLNDISFKVKEGEILGIAGVEGNGQTELVEVLTGLMQSSNGCIKLKDEDITNLWPNELRKKGMGIIPENRYTNGLCLDMTIADNIIAGNHWNKKYYTKGLFNKGKINQERDQLIDKYDIRISNQGDNVSSLSGGNAQKIIVAREFSKDPQVLIISQPTRGVDVGSIEYIHKEILKLQDAKKTIVLVSSELSEIMSLSDRIAVMFKGSIIGIVDAKGATKEEIGLLMAGITN